MLSCAQNKGTQLVMQQGLQRVLCCSQKYAYAYNVFAAPSALVLNHAEKLIKMLRLFGSRNTENGLFNEKAQPCLL